ncbi:hypothetical protein [Spirosoma panaciterrae]|nr:hypothetical protein [Spirosoma panaciterrae]
MAKLNRQMGFAKPVALLAVRNGTNKAARRANEAKNDGLVRVKFS